MTTIWTVRLSSAATSDYESLDHSVASQVDLAIEKLSTSPELRGYPLRDNLAGFRSLVVGKKKLRMVYKVINDEVLVYVIAIGWRRDGEVYLASGDRIEDSPD